MSIAPEHADAVEVMLAPLRDQHVELYDTVAPPLDQRASEYVIFTVTIPRPHRGRRLGGTSTGRMVRVTTRYCGSKPALVRSAASKTHALLLDQYPVIQGRMTTPIQYTSGSPVLPQEGSDPTRFHATDVWEYTSDPTGA